MLASKGSIGTGGGRKRTPGAPRAPPGGEREAAARERGSRYGTRFGIANPGRKMLESDGMRWRRIFIE
ncbi:hypothetical protein BOC35_06625 [Burkholderia pseudomallei]|nr:hypothetical protein BOC35_06625 [Burkholderia pseudomallei]ARL25210.1 hypothetical protein BOC47_22660 [Burkholderia pseudomallei]